MIDELVAEFGERHRATITGAIEWLDVNEPKWGLDAPIDRRMYIAKILGLPCPGTRLT
jgi:hypothetical protein